MREARQHSTILVCADEATTWQVAISVNANGRKEAMVCQKSFFPFSPSSSSSFSIPFLQRLCEEIRVKINGEEYLCAANNWVQPGIQQTYPLQHVGM